MGNVASRETAMRAIWAELDRQCGIGAGEWHTDSETGLMEVHASLDPFGFADAMLAALHDTAPTDQAQRGGEVDRDALIAAAWKSIDEGDASGLGHASFPTTWGRNEDPHVCYVDGTFHLGDLVDAILAALAQSGKGVISTPNMPKGGEQ